MKTLEQIKKEIHTINPNVTDELLDLLYEYVFTKYFYNYKKINTNNFSDMLNYILNPLNCKDNNS